MKENECKRDTVGDGGMKRPDEPDRREGGRKIKSVNEDPLTPKTGLTRAARPWEARFLKVSQDALYEDASAPRR